MREEHWLRVFENRVMRRIFGPKRGDVQESEENYRMGGLMNCTAHPMLFAIKLTVWRWAGHVARMGGKESCIHGSGGET